MENEEFKIRATNVYLRTIEALPNYKILVEEGGSRSSKTFSLFQLFFNMALEGNPFTLTIVRSKLTWIKATLLKDFEEIAALYGDKIEITPEINQNRPEQVYDVNGSEFAFFGLDYPQKLHGRKQHYTWGNEVMEMDKKSFDQLELRTSEKMFLDYNPADDSHWVFELQKRPDVCLIKSTVLDNPFAPEANRKKILSFEPTPENIINGTADEYMWQVYGLGNKAKLKGVIFNNWDLVDEVPKDAKFIASGLDFGYTNHPTALIELFLYNNEIYANEAIYETGLTNDDITNRMDSLLIDRYAKIFADSAEPKSIEEIYRNGFKGIEAVEKGADSISFGIDILKQYKIHITKKSINLEKEFRHYKWAMDKNDNPLNKPIDDFNHAIDALRYAAMMTLKKHDEVRVLQSLI